MLPLYHHETFLSRFNSLKKKSLNILLRVFPHRYVVIDMIYLLTAIVQPPSGSSTVHIYTHNAQNDTKQTIHRTTQKFWKIADRAPSLRVLLWHLPYDWGKARKNLSQGSRRVPAGMMKIHKYAIRIHRHNNKIRKLQYQTGIQPYMH